MVERGLAACALLALSPILGLVSLMVRLRLGRPLLFVQVRSGLHGVPFELYKFRTMADMRGPDDHLLPDEDRLTRFGRRLRETSLDELPELWNVVKGDMRFIGPRPLPVRYLARFTPEELRRHDVRPGLTGWAQVNGRNAVEWDARLAMDVWYVDNRSLLLDLRIVLRTVGIVLRRDGIRAEGAETMHELRPHLAYRSTEEAS